MNAVTNLRAMPLTFGGAVKLSWVNPIDAGFDHVRVIRKTAPGFSGPNDPSATVIYTGPGMASDPEESVFAPSADPARARSILDTVRVEWATTYYYAVYAMDQAEADVSAAALVTAITTLQTEFEEVDVIGSLIPFLDAYFRRQIAAGLLKVRSAVTEIPVVDGPPLMDTVKLPTVSLHLESDTPKGYTIGDVVHDLDQEGDQIVSREGYLSGVTVSIVGWTDNPETRRGLYRCMKGAMVAAKPFLDTLGMQNMQVSGSYLEEFESYEFPAFMARLTLQGDLVTSIRATNDIGVIQQITANGAVVASA